MKIELTHTHKIILTPNKTIKQQLQLNIISK